MLIFSFWMPESPRYLILAEKYEQAEAILKKMHMNDEDDTLYLREFHQIKAQIMLDKQESLGMRGIWARPSYRKRFLLVFWYAIACM